MFDWNSEEGEWEEDVIEEFDPFKKQSRFRDENLFLSQDLSENNPLLADVLAKADKIISKYKDKTPNICELDVDCILEESGVSNDD